MLEFKQIGPEPSPVQALFVCAALKRLLLRWRQVGATALRHFRRHTDALAQGWMRVDRLADVHRIRTHLDRQRHLADHVARVRADHTAAQDLAVAMGFGAVIEQQLGHALIATVGNCTAGGAPRKQTFFDLDALRLGLVFGQADPGHFGVGIGHIGNKAGVERSSRQFGVALLLACDFPAAGRAAHRLQHRVTDFESVPKHRRQHRYFNDNFKYGQT